MAGLSELFTDIAVSIRTKTGSSEPIVAMDFPEAIDSIPVTDLDSELATQDELIDQIYEALDNISEGGGNTGGDSDIDLSVVTADAADVLTGKTIVNASGNPVNGTMPNNGKVTKTLNTSTTSYTIAKGYHDGTGTVSITTEEKTVTPTTSVQTITPTSGKVLSKVTVNAASGGTVSTQTKTVTPSASTQTVTPDSGKYLSSVTVNGDSDLIASNIKSGVNIFGVTGNYAGSTKVYTGSVSCSGSSFSISSLNLSSISQISICFALSDTYDTNCFAYCRGSGSSLSGRVWVSDSLQFPIASASASLSGSTLTITSSNSSYRFSGTANYVIVGT